MNKKKQMYKAPEGSILKLAGQLNLLNSLSNPHQAEFGDLENRDEWV